MATSTWQAQHNIQTPGGDSQTTWDHPMAAGRQGR